ncbi:hypothetical protein OG196_42950 (plasmid) [Kitasatospora purpeofusca]|uniref:hypothetical protein n=1 Tax=Kitasatospora purpeofusca TaxID=67352 RepID=UPI002E150CAF|nr:hypothetical protein OG196_42950 [Kitasatospora purpeofusca]
MTATPSHLDLPARRRRHARLIAALTTAVGACAEAAGKVYGPIAAAPPGQEEVVVDPLPVVYLSHTAAPLLEAARAEDEARWPDAVAREREQGRRTFAARVAVARAQELLEEPGAPGPVPLPTAEQGAAIDLASAGDEIAELWREDPAQALARAGELAAGGEFTAAEVLDTAVDTAIGAGLLALVDARTATEPSLMAEQCLQAVPHLVLAVALASADPH